MSLEKKIKKKKSKDIFDIKSLLICLAIGLSIAFFPGECSYFLKNGPKGYSSDPYIYHSIPLKFKNYKKNTLRVKTISRSGDFISKEILYFLDSDGYFDVREGYAKGSSIPIYYHFNNNLDNEFSPGDDILNDIKENGLNFDEKHIKVSM